MAYKAISLVDRSLKGYKIMDGRNQKEEDEIYQSQVGSMTMMQWVSMVEIGVVIVLGGYQYLRLRSIIAQKAAE